MPAVGLTPSRTVIAENVRDLQSWSSHGRRCYGAGGFSVSCLARLRRGTLRPPSGLSILEISLSRWSGCWGEADVFAQAYDRRG